MRTTLRCTNSWTFDLLTGYSTDIRESPNIASYVGAQGMPDHVQTVQIDQLDQLI